jgi:Phage integrase, N-terminal SAM-like domain
LHLLDGAPRGSMTLQDYTYDVWWPEYAEANLSDETRNNYATQLDLRVIPKWGAHPLRSLEPRPIEAWVSELRTEGVGAATIIKTLTVFRAILKRAERDLEIDRNPIDVVELAPELGHSATTCLKYYARVFEEFRGLPRCLAWSARRARPSRPVMYRPGTLATATRAPTRSGHSAKPPISREVVQSPLPDSNRRPLPYHGSRAGHGMPRGK